MQEITRKLEAAAAANLRAYVEAYRAAVPNAGASAIGCGGGVAAFAGPGSPLTTVKGAGPEIGDEEIDAVEAFFASNGAARVVFELAPWITPDTAQRLARRGYAPTAAEAVVIHDAPFPHAVVPGVAEMDAERWGPVMFEAFGLEDAPSWHDLARASAAVPGAVNLGFYGHEGRPVACAQITVYGPVAILGCDGTLPRARGRGAQAALIGERLRRCSLLAVQCAAAEVEPGGQSERNYLRRGFRPAYTRTHYSKGRH